MDNINWCDAKQVVPFEGHTVLVWVTYPYRQEKYNPNLVFIGWYDPVGQRWVLNEFPKEPYDVTHWASFRGPNDEIVR